MADDQNSWVSERDLAETLNVKREVLKSERPYLLSGEVEEQSGVIMWLKKAAQRVADKLGLALTEKNAAATVETVQASDETEVLTVFSQPMPPAMYHFPNPRVIKARRVNGEVVVVSVLDSRKYTTRLAGGEPMTLRAKKSPEMNVWRLIGREPRYRGRW